jgi:hypothetical protein
MYHGPLWCLFKLVSMSADDLKGETEWAFVGRCEIIEVFAFRIFHVLCRVSPIFPTLCRIIQANEDLKSGEGNLYHKFVVYGRPIVDAEPESGSDPVIPQVDMIATGQMATLWRNRLKVNTEYIFSGCQIKKSEYKGKESTTVILGRHMLAE